MLANLIVNTAVGAQLFPFIHMNRAAHITYYPSTFTKKLSQKITHLKKRPLFIAAHFELSHWPFIYAANKKRLSTSYYDPSKFYPSYSQVIQKVDKEVGQFIQTLKQQKLWDNSIVILLSDHGEGFELTGDRITSLAGFLSTKKVPKPQLRFTLLNQSRGHGTDILSSIIKQSILLVIFL